MNSEIIGLGKRDKAEGFSGMESSRVCVDGDVRTPLWSTIVAIEAARMERSMLKATKHTMAGERFHKVQNGKLMKRWVSLYPEITVDDVWGDNENSKACKRRWRKKTKETRGKKQQENLDTLYARKKEEMKAKAALTLTEQRKQGGTSTAVMYMITAGIEGETRVQWNGRTNNTLGERQRFRRLRAGMIKGLKAARRRRGREWEQMNEQEQIEEVACKCGDGKKIQDAWHVIFECEDTATVVDMVMDTYKQVKRMSTTEAAQWMQKTREQRIRETMNIMTTEGKNKVAEEMIRAWGQVVQHIETKGKNSQVSTEIDTM